MTKCHTRTPYGLTGVNLNSGHAENLIPERTQPCVLVLLGSRVTFSPLAEDVLISLQLKVSPFHISFKKTRGLSSGVFLH